MPFQYRVVSAERGERSLERALNEAASAGYRFVAVVGAYTILEREIPSEAAGDDATVEVFKGECPVCGSRYVIPVSERELRKARVNPGARVVKKTSPQCGHEILLQVG